MSDTSIVITVEGEMLDVVYHSFAIALVVWVNKLGDDARLSRNPIYFYHDNLHKISCRLKKRYAGV